MIDYLPFSALNNIDSCISEIPCSGENRSGNGTFDLDSGKAAWPRQQSNVLDSGGLGLDGGGGQQPNKPQFSDALPGNWRDCTRRLLNP